MKTKTTTKPKALKIANPVKTRAARKKRPAATLTTKGRKQRNKRVAFFVAIAVAVCGILGIAALWAAPANKASYRFVSGLGNEKCLDNANQKLENRNTIMLYTCNNTAAQGWEQVGNTIRIVGSAYCMDFSNETINGIKRDYLLLARCTRSPSQQWKVNSNNTITSMKDGRCLDVQGGKAVDRTRIILWKCTAGAKNQQWFMKKVTSTAPIPSLGETATVKVEGATKKVDFEAGWDYTQNSKLFGGGNAAAVKSATDLARTLAAPQATHILGFGLGSPNPSKGKYYWGDLDARVTMMKATTPQEKRTIILCCAPKWMKGTKTDADNNNDLETAPTQANYDNFATLAAEIAKRYKNDVPNFVVWNEFKGFNRNGYGTTAYSSYTNLYNKVYTAVKNANPSAKVGGPYIGMDTEPAIGNETYGHLALHSQAAYLYWDTHKIGADFVAVDGGPQQKNGTILTDGYTAGNKFADDAKLLRSPTKPLPIWWMEFYPATERDNKFVDPVGNHAVSITMSNIITAGLGGVNRMLVWEPEGRNDGTHPYTGYGVWTSTAASGGGKATSFYTGLKLLHDNFPLGTQLYKTTVTGKVTALASGNKVMLISRTANSLTVDVGDKKTTLKPYEVVVVNR